MGSGPVMNPGYAFLTIENYSTSTADWAPNSMSVSRNRFTYGMYAWRTMGWTILVEDPRQRHHEGDPHITLGTEGIWEKIDAVSRRIIQGESHSIMHEEVETQPNIIWVQLGQRRRTSQKHKCYPYKCGQVNYTKTRKMYRTGLWNDKYWEHHSRKGEQASIAHFFQTYKQQLRFRVHSYAGMITWFDNINTTPNAMRTLFKSVNPPWAFTPFVNEAKSQ